MLDSTIDTEETLRTSPEEARRIRREVQKIVSRGAFETAPLDEFGLAALGELREIVPGLVETNADGVVESLDRPATRAFLRYATSDAERALRKPANDEVFAIEEVIREAEPGPTPRSRRGAASRRPHGGRVPARHRARPQADLARAGRPARHAARRPLTRDA